MADLASLSTITSRLVRRRAGVAAATVAAVGAAVLGAAGVVPAGAASTAPGHWTVVGASLGQPEAGTPAVWEDATHHAWVLWQRALSSSLSTYEVVEMAANGTLAKGPTDVFAGADWISLSNQPTLLPAGGQPQLVFSGIQSSTGAHSLGCVYSAVGGASPWTVAPGALSSSCVNPIGNSAESKTGVLATAFPGGWTGGHGVLYHVGSSATVPATELDGQIPIASGNAYKTSVVNDAAGNGDFTVVWAQEFSNPGSGDGFYVQDITAGTAARKAPGTGTSSINSLPVFGNIAVTSTTSHAGDYLAYCSKASICKVQLWKVGAAKALTVPGSTNARDVAIAAGPGGRLWISWYNESTNKLSVVRTNMADTKFGPVKTYATGCFEHGLIGLGGTGGRLDIALQCVNNATKLQEAVTQSLVPLQVGLSASSLTSTAKHTLIVSVTDVGNPVKGAKVVVAGHRATTNAKGKATITLPKGAKAGSYKVSASATDYVTATAGLSIKS